MEDGIISANLAREQGNKYFQIGKFEDALNEYSRSISLYPTPAAYNNRAACQMKLEKNGAAIMDSEEAIKLDPGYIKAYFREGLAYFSLQKFQEAQEKFKKVLSLDPNNREASSKLQFCKREMYRVGMEEAIHIEVKLASETFISKKLSIDNSYEGEIFDDENHPMSLKFIQDMLQRFKNGKLIHKTLVVRILLKVLPLFKALPSLVHHEIGANKKITVFGDIHGQFFDLLNIFELNGLPSDENSCLFNGDFVDRGSWSVEVILTLFALKILYPTGLLMNRGNHESHHLNSIYGFQGEVKAKYKDDELYWLFQEVFNWIPLCYVLNKKVMVVHGGLFKQDGVLLKDIEKINRNRDIPDEGLMTDILWADPQKEFGRGPSKRGVSIQFGPDVTEKFLKENQLELLVRSHEAKQEGYEIEANGHLITVFSAPNYVDQMHNLGAYIHFYGSDMKPIIKQFSWVKHPDVKAMCYANNMFGM